MLRMMKEQEEIRKKLDNATDTILNGLNSQATRDKITALEADLERIQANMDTLHKQMQSTTIDDGQIEYLLGRVMAVGCADDNAILSIVVRVEVCADNIAI